MFVSKKIKVVPSHAVKTQTVNGGIAPLILNSSLNGVDWLFSHPGCFTSWEVTPAPIEFEAERAWTFWRIEKSLAPAGI